MVDKSIAIIPARGGSKRIPKKNIIPFHGKPLIAWTIQAAIKSEVFEKVIVSTDDQEIAEISIEYGAEVPFLRQKYADDQSPVSLAIWKALKQAINHYHETYDTVVSLMPNCPLRTYQDIVTMKDYFDQDECNFLLSCSDFGWTNPWWAFSLDKENKPDFINKNSIKNRSQDLPILYTPSGAIWMANVVPLLKTKSFYGHEQKFFPIS